MTEITFKLTNESPLLMHNAQLSDPLNYYSKQIKRVSSKRKKVDADQDELGRLEFLGSLYTTEVDGKPVPCLPGEVLEATIVGAGRTRKLGKQVQSGVYVLKDAPLKYDGPTDPDELWLDERFRLRRSVKVQRARIMRTRPKFDKWTADVTISLYETDIDKKTVEELMTIAGELVGVGDWRPRYGRFSVSK